MTVRFGRYGRVTLSALEAPAGPAQRPLLSLCTYKEHEPKPITLLLEASFVPTPGLVYPRWGRFFLPCQMFIGTNETDSEIAPAGLMIIEYGAGGSINHVIADLKPGAFALPMCDYVQVSVTSYCLTGTLRGINVAGTLLEGQHKNPARLTATDMKRLQPAASAVGRIPGGARWVDVQGGHVENTIASPPIVTPGNVRWLEESYAMPSGVSLGGGRYILQNTALGSHEPDSTPVELSSGGNQYRVWNDAEDAAVITTKFFLEL